MKQKRNAGSRRTDWVSLFAMAVSLLAAGNYFINGKAAMGVLWLAASALFFGGFVRRSHRN